MTDATEMKKEKSLEIFFGALFFLEPLHYGFKLQGSNQSGYCICSLAKGLTLWKRNHEIVDDYLSCGMKPFQGQSLIQHCVLKGDEYHTATAIYLKTLFGASRIKKGCQVIKDSIRLLSIMGKVLMIN
jgi:hypothetical protein